MVHTFLAIALVVSVIVWLVQELYVRQQVRLQVRQLVTSPVLVTDEFLEEQYPSWSQWLVWGALALWGLWLFSVVRFKDGNLEVILVTLTIAAAIVGAIDKWGFGYLRQRFLAETNTQQWLQKFPEDKRKELIGFLSLPRDVGENARSFFPVLIVVLLLRSFLVEPFQIPSSSMVPTLQVGDFIVVNKFKYGLRLPAFRTKIWENESPQRGDVMVFFPPHQPDTYFIKRVVGLPGDDIRYVNNVLYVNGEEQPQTLIKAEPPVNPRAYIMNETLDGVEHAMRKDRVPGDLSRNIHKVVPEGHYFMMGDNRDNSNDSRAWGAVPEENIVGEAFAIWMHLPSFPGIPSFSRAGAIQ